ncbi:MAG: hypothetical protein M1484_02280 [Patescibacteria group bacterium]|nr:hypothetical protein [Patescibacteria group bacterium]
MEQLDSLINKIGNIADDVTLDVLPDRQASKKKKARIFHQLTAGQGNAKSHVSGEREGAKKKGHHRHTVIR